MAFQIKMAGDEIEVRVAMKEGAVIFYNQSGNQRINGGCSNSSPPQREGHLGSPMPEGVGYGKPMEAFDPPFQIFFLFGNPSPLDEFNHDRTGNGDQILVQKEGDGIFDLRISPSGEETDPGAGINENQGRHVLKGFVGFCAALAHLP